MAGKDSLLADLVAPVVAALDYELWGVEYLAHGKQSVVRIYIDSPDGIDVDDCARLSRQISSVFDVEDPIMGEYTLEVSSPGMDRPLFTLAQFGRYIGEQVKIRLRSPFEGRRKFFGLITGIEGDEVVVAVDDHEYLLPFEMIDKANIVPRF
jgi:ribosome maturation factor RimP